MRHEPPRYKIRDIDGKSGYNITLEMLHIESGFKVIFEAKMHPEMRLVCLDLIKEHLRSEGITASYTYRIDDVEAVVTGKSCSPAILCNGQLMRDRAAAILNAGRLAPETCLYREKKKPQRRITFEGVKKI